MSDWIAETPGETNVALIDDWTPVHAMVGFGAGLLGINAGLYVLGSIAYEALEISVETPSGSKVFGTKKPETLANSAADVGAGVVGYFSARVVLRLLAL